MLTSKTSWLLFSCSSVFCQAQPQNRRGKRKGLSSLLLLFALPWEAGPQGPQQYFLGPLASRWLSSIRTLSGDQRDRGRELRVFTSLAGRTTQSKVITHPQLTCSLPRLLPSDLDLAAALWVLLASFLHQFLWFCLNPPTIL